jgi:hypothetical protein
MAGGGILNVCSRAKRPESTAWLVMSVNTIQHEPGGKRSSYFGQDC